MNARLGSADGSDWSARQATIALSVISLIAIVLRAAATLREPMGYNAFSDDNAYINAAATFLNTGYVTYSSPDARSGVLGIGMPLLLGLIFAVCGYQPTGLLLAHIVYSLFGVATALGAYLFGKRLHSRKAGVLAAALVALDIGLVFTNSAFYTETPYMCFNLFALYLFMCCAKQWSLPRYLGGVACFCLAASLKGLALLAPVCVLPLLWAYRVPLRKWLPKALMVAVIFLLVFLPWCYRNLQVFGSFTPFPTSQGDQKLLGTYVGIGKPEGDYQTDIQALHTQAWEQGYTEDNLRRIADAGRLANARLSAWIQENPVGFVITHLLYKPLRLITQIFYPRQMLGIPIPLAMVWWWLCLALAVVGLVLTKRERREKAFYMPLLYLIVAVFVTAVYLPLDRYNTPHIPLVMIYTGIGLSELGARMRARRRTRKGACAALPE